MATLVQLRVSDTRGVLNREIVVAESTSMYNLHRTLQFCIKPNQSDSTVDSKVSCSSQCIYIHFSTVVEDYEIYQSLLRVSYRRRKVVGYGTSGTFASDDPSSDSQSASRYTILHESYVLYHALRNNIVCYNHAYTTGVATIVCSISSCKCSMHVVQFKHTLRLCSLFSPGPLIQRAR